MILSGFQLFFWVFLFLEGSPDLRKSSLNLPEGTPDLICPTLFPNFDCIAGQYARYQARMPGQSTRLVSGWYTWLALLRLH